MTLIIKELVVRSTIVDKLPTSTGPDEHRLKEEVVRACTAKLIRHFNRQKQR